MAKTAFSGVFAEALSDMHVIAATVWQRELLYTEVTTFGQILEKI